MICKFKFQTIIFFNAIGAKQKIMIMNQRFHIQQKLGQGYLTWTPAIILQLALLYKNLPSGEDLKEKKTEIEKADGITIIPVLSLYTPSLLLGIFMYTRC
ncbi:hypothetical protein ACOSP7_003711 [Xanthoceras sorbifolium]